MKLTVAGFDFVAIAPEVILSLGAMLILVGGLFVKRAMLPALTVLVLLGSMGALIPGLGDNVRAFDDTVALDGFALFFKAVLLLSALLSVLISMRFLKEEGGPAPEFFTLMLFATAGMMLMASATDLMLVFLALETFSLALYVLVAFRRRRLDSQEGALKYFLTGSFASAFFLYGIALIYGATGSTRMLAIASTASSSSLLTAGLALLIVGLAFKVGAVPFHMWTPDAYQGAPSPVTGFMAAGSKVAGFAVMLRLFHNVFASLVWDWRPALIAIAAVTMVVGSIIAISQTNVKRVLAYSAIAHSGFLLIGVLSVNDQGITGSMFYLAVYAVTIVAAFGIVHAVGGVGEETVSLDDYRGLGARQPFLAGSFAILLFSLAGLPPTAGFWAKFEVFKAGYSAGQAPLVVLALLSSAVAAFVYVRVIWLMFFEAPVASSDDLVTAPPATGLVVFIVCGLVLFLGIQPTPLLDLVRHVTFVFH
ncbi:MAG: NADH-quinone oxidoreductase subunit N [Actinomycetota bacterium]